MYETRSLFKEEINCLQRQLISKGLEKYEVILKQHLTLLKVVYLFIYLFLATRYGIRLTWIRTGEFPLVHLVRISSRSVAAARIFAHLTRKDRLARIRR